MDLISEFTSYHKDDFWAQRSEVRRQNFVNKYSNEVILGLSQEEYNYAGKEDTFCYRIQRDLACLSSMGNAFPAVFGVYVNLDHRVRLSRNLEAMFGTDFGGALKYQKEQIVSLIVAGKEQDFRFIENSDINQQFRFKILSVYSPEIYFPVCTRPTAEAYCNALGIKYSSYSTMLDLVISLSTWARNNLPRDWGLCHAMSLSDWLWRENRTLNDSTSYADSVIFRKPINTTTVCAQKSNEVKNIPSKEPEKTDEDFLKLFPKGCRVRHSKFGFGIVQSIEDGVITLKLDNGKIKEFGVDFCVKSKLLTRV